MKQKVFRTSLGINTSNIIIPAMCLLILLFIFLAQLPQETEDASPGFSFFLFMAFIVLFIGLFLIFIFPNTNTIELNVEQKKLKIFIGHNKIEIIEVKNVKKITLIRQFFNSFLSEVCYYQLEYLDTKGNLAKLCFKVVDKESKKFIQEMKNNRE